MLMAFIYWALFFLLLNFFAAIFVGKFIRRGSR